MMGINDLGVYLLGAIAIVLLPGPNSMYVLSVASTQNVKQAYRAACGVFLGDAILMLLASVGILSVLTLSSRAIQTLRYVGAAYLVWIGLSMLIKAYRHWRFLEKKKTPPLITEKYFFTKALFVSLINPKSFFFFASFFVQFVDTQAPHAIINFLVLATILEITSLLYLSLLIFFGQRIKSILASDPTLRVTTMLFLGILFIGFCYPITP
jgi:leucine efflux protein